MNALPQCFLDDPNEQQLMSLNHSKELPILLNMWPTWDPENVNFFLELAHKLMVCWIKKVFGVLL